MNNTVFIFKYLFFLSMVISALPTFGHGDLHERIQKVTKEIKSNPDSAYLYFKRGMLYQQHEEAQKALEDLLQASERNYSDEQLDFTFAKVYLDLANYTDALIYLDKILTNDENHVNSWKLKGKVFFAMRKYDQAANAYLQVIIKTTESFPDNYFDVAQCYELQNNALANIKAIGIIEEGIETLGPLLTFYEKLVELHIKSGDFNNALINQSEILNLSKRLENPLFERANIHLLLGNQKEALEDFEAAKQALDKLPLRLQNHLAMRELREKIESEIDLLK